MTTTPAAPAVPPTFNEVFFTAARSFADACLADIAELEGIAVVPSWRVPQPYVAYGLMLGRYGALRTPEELIHMSEQLWSCLDKLSSEARSLITALDKQMGDLADRGADLLETIREREQQLRELDAELSRRQTASEQPPA